MAWVLERLVDVAGRIDWVGRGTWVAGRGRSISVFTATLPRECKAAAIHTSLVCAGYPPEYESIPGFGPIPLGWGWLVLGIVSGLLFGYLLWDYTNRRKIGRNMADARDQALLNMVKYIQHNGNTGLRQMASQSQLSDTDFLYCLVGCTRVEAPPGLPP